MLAWLLFLDVCYLVCLLVHLLNLLICLHVRLPCPWSIGARSTMLVQQRVIPVRRGPGVAGSDGKIKVLPTAQSHTVMKDISPGGG